MSLAVYRSVKPRGKLLLISLCTVTAVKGVKSPQYCFLIPKKSKTCREDSITLFTYIAQKLNLWSSRRELNSSQIQIEEPKDNLKKMYSAYVKRNCDDFSGKFFTIIKLYNLYLTYSIFIMKFF